MTIARDIIGEKFGRLKAIKFFEKKNKNNSDYWLWKCDCGNEKVILKTHVTSGSIVSCGCYQLEKTTKHGLHKTRFYNIWGQIKQRCLNRDNKNYHHYGGRGITVCDRWLKFKNFRDDMYESYLDHKGKYGRKNTSIDRIDVNGNYCPENCKWATVEEQNNNTRYNILITYNGETLTLTEWSNKLNINRDTLVYRHKKGWKDDDIITRPKNYHGRQITYKNKTQNFSQWERELGMSLGLISRRLDLNWTIEDAITKPVRKMNIKKI